MRDAISYLKSGSARCRLSALSLAAALCIASASAMAADGLNSQSGQTLPIGAGGTTAIQVFPNGQVSVGLPVAGETRPPGFDPRFSVKGTVDIDDQIFLWSGGTKSSGCGGGGWAGIRAVPGPAGTFTNKLEACTDGTANGWSQYGFMPPGAVAGWCEARNNSNGTNTTMGTPIFPAIAGGTSGCTCASGWTLQFMSERPLAGLQEINGFWVASYGLAASGSVPQTANIYLCRKN
ncbi:MAG: hypothetical protein SFW62_10050 [Alphaproteobacteria bacterium]|nr:hypothetical protein [Alphaproteobacteria bacterium]